MLLTRTRSYSSKGRAERVSGCFQLPVLERLLAAFPFDVLGFHSDNDSKYLNHRLALRMQELDLEEFAKSL